MGRHLACCREYREEGACGRLGHNLSGECLVLLRGLEAVGCWRLCGGSIFYAGIVVFLFFLVLCGHLLLSSVRGCVLGWREHSSVSGHTLGSPSSCLEMSINKSGFSQSCRKKQACIGFLQSVLSWLLRI